MHLLETQELSRIFKVLSVDTRIKILGLLRQQPFCVNALAHFLGITPAAVSQHLRVMRDAGIVIGEKRGYFIHYRINSERLGEWRQAAAELLSPDGDVLTFR